MKFFVSIIITAFLGYVIGLFTSFPWWSFAVTSFVVALGIEQSSTKSFFSGFLGIFILWIVLAYLQDSANAHLLSTKVANILPLNGSFTALIAITGLIGGLVGGFAALTASFTRKPMRRHY